MQLISEHAKNLSKLLFWSIFVFKNFKVYPYIYTHKLSQVGYTRKKSNSACLWERS